MTKRQTSDAFAPRIVQGQALTFALPSPVDLGQHILDVDADEQTVLVFKKLGPGRQVRASQVQLSKEEAYRLLVNLQWVFRQEMEREEEKEA